MDIDQEISVIKKSLANLDNRLTQLSKEKQHEVQWLPRNIQSRIEEYLKAKTIGESEKAQFVALMNEFDRLVEKHGLSRGYFQLSDKKD